LSIADERIIKLSQHVAKLSRDSMLK